MLCSESDRECSLGIPQNSEDAEGLLRVDMVQITPPPKFETANTGAFLPPPGVDRGYIYADRCQGGCLGGIWRCWNVAAGMLDPMLGKGVNTGKGWSGWEIK
jgi:hypothetical protein